MIDLGQHAEFIAAAYLGVSFGIALLMVWTLFASRKVSRRLAELGDKRG